MIMRIIALYSRMTGEGFYEIERRTDRAIFQRRLFIAARRIDRCRPRSDYRRIRGACRRSGRRVVGGGENFAALAIEFSQGQQNLNGGRLGWLKGEQLPTIFIQAATQLDKDEVSQPFRSSSGFHLILLHDFKGIQPILQDQIRLRHILIKTNEILDDDAAKEKLKTIRDQIINDGDFGAIAAAVSEDAGSAQEGGDMGWTGSGFFVPEFEEIALAMENDEISEPFKSRYGWHIIQFLGKRVFDNTNEIQKRQAIAAIRNSKLSDEIELWARQLRDEAFVEYISYYD